MNITVTRESVPSSDGIHTLIGKTYIPEGKIKGLFHVVHGMTEHIDRYDGFMHEIAEQGYICFGYDHLGHGKTVNSTDELGFIAHKDGWNYLAKDVSVFAFEMKKKYGDYLPYYLMGHSMGSFISRLAAEKYIKPDKFIIMGTGGPNPAAGIGLIAIDVVKFFKGERYISKAIDNLAFGTYNSHFKDENDPIAWLTKDREQKKKYASDPYCTFKFTVSAMHDLVTLNKKANRAAWFQNIKMPVLLVSGADDPVGNYGKGVTKVYEKLKKAGCNVQIKLYENCRHEILNDTCRDEVIHDIENFIE